LSAECRRLGGSLAEHIRTRHHAPETSGVVERFNRSLKYEHLYQREIEQAAELAADLSLDNRVRPHEALGQRIPLAAHRGDQHLLAASGVHGS
jgi:transposase InsO family protein